MIVNFDAKVDQILNEGILSATGSFLKAAQNPAYVGELIGKFAENKKKKGEKGIGKDNPPKVGDYVQYETNTIGKVTEVLNGGANFKVILVGMSPLSEGEVKKLNSNGIFSKFNRKSILKAHEQPGKSLTVFVKTVNNPKWHLVSIEKGRDLESNIGAEKDKEGNKKEQLLVVDGVKQITFQAMCGEKTAFKEWFFYTGEIEQNIEASASIGLHTPPPPKDVPVGSTIEFDLKGKGVKPYRKDATGWFQYTDNTFTKVQIGISNADSIKALEDAWRTKHP